MTNELVDEQYSVLHYDTHVHMLWLDFQLLFPLSLYFRFEETGFCQTLATRIVSHEKPFTSFSFMYLCLKSKRVPKDRVRL